MLTSSIIPAHCVWCGHETRDIPRACRCPDCGTDHPWGSDYAPYPSAETKARAIRKWKQQIGAMNPQPEKCP